jgi:predicted phage terminase large subunit-like protein
VARLEAADAADRLRRAAAAKQLALVRSAPPNPETTLEFAERLRHFPLATPWFHKVWYDAMDDESLKRLFIMGPRLHAKTSCVLTYTLRRLCENHQLRVGIISQTDALAKHFLADLKYEFESNPELLRRYGPSGGRRFRGDRWTMHQITLSDAHDGPRGISGKDVSVFSVGRGGQITGYHCDLLIVDDLETKEATDSDLVRQGTREWWSREVEPVLVPGGKLIGTGTRKHFDDIYSYWLQPGSGWQVVDAVKSVFKPDGTPIWPEMWSIEALKARKAQMDLQDLLAWSQEYLNEPRPAETQMFYPDAWPTYVKPPFGLNILQYWDLAISERTGADYTVGWTIGVDRENNVFLLERRRGHWDFNTTLAEIESMGAAWPTVQAIGIEQVAYQAAAVQEALRRTMLPIVPDKITGGDKDKVTRARLLEARAAAKKVVRPEDAPWWPEFAQEALFFPAGAHDDQIDALSGAVRLAGFSASSIAWQYGVWECRNPTCKHQFRHEKGRHCPKCGLQVPDTFENPEAAG